MPRFSKPVYDDIARILDGEMAVRRDSDEAVHALKGVAYSLADLFARDNPNFDRERFYAAAGVGVEP